MVAVGPCLGGRRLPDDAGRVTTSKKAGRGVKSGKLWAMPLVMEIGPAVMKEVKKDILMRRGGEE